MARFPADFLWGAATAAYQVEGDNFNSDWWHWEKKAGKPRSGPACGHYSLYREDFDLARSLGHNAHRLSIEWSRVEPEEGKFSSSALRHYVEVILALRERGLEPLVTLHHFTNPLWFSRKGGWEKKSSVPLFLRYAGHVAAALAGHVRYWITINEPTVYITHGYIFGVWPPQRRSYLKAFSVEANLLSAHVKAFRLLHKTYSELGLAAPRVGIAQNMMSFLPCRPVARDRFAARVRDKWYNFGFLDRIAAHKAMDFAGINYYSRQVVELRRWGLMNLAKDVCRKGHHPVRKNCLGWDIYPEGLYELLVKLKKYGLPVIVTENGICAADDGQRWDYIREHLMSVHRAMEEGVPVAGYLYWSLMDNFEWDKGFAPRFGLIDIDYVTFKRTVRESARKYAQVCRTGILE